MSCIVKQQVKLSVQAVPLRMTSWPQARQEVKWAQGRCCRVGYSSPEHEAALNLRGQTCHSA